MEILRKDKRRFDQLRPIKITRNVNKYALGSALIEMGDTKVLCCVSMEEKVPLFLKNTGSGWLTAEYGMMPLSCPERIMRTSYSSGRNMEIQRLVGRALRSIVYLKNLGEKTLWIDCDVIQADGGTRTAAINGSFIALVDALYVLNKRNILAIPALKDYISAISVGIVNGECYLDLSYSEDSIAQVDFNVVMNGRGEFVELQGTAEGASFSKELLDKIIALAGNGIKEIITIQKDTLKDEIKSLLGK
ncbi:MAG: ribonuclease PH [Actinobacteria bacterium]|nr:ribonuclease PH [Actinomycetota bacterium]MCL5408806.1 ribonuclease PH [Candidatus Omnitrophota bacterium]